jgi:hypothetical protein
MNIRFFVHPTIKLATESISQIKDRRNSIQFERNNIAIHGGGGEEIPML